MNRLSCYLAVGIILTFAACSDQGPNPAGITPRVADGVMTCQVNVATQLMSCDPQSQPAAGLALNTTFGGANGGAGAYVQLASSGTAYAGTSFTSTVTITNLTAQPMGTADGTAADANGVRVYFVSGPTATGGTGTVTVAGDGVGNLTGAGQQYYQYTGPLAPSAASAGKTWTFNVPPTVATFSFGVLVSAKLPDDAGVLHWVKITPPAGTETAAWDEIEGNNGELWAVGTGGKIVHYTDGAGWVLQTVPPADTFSLHGIEVHGTTGVAVGAHGTFLYYNGSTWTDHSVGAAEMMHVSKLGSSGMWIACGLGGVIFTSADGQAWTQQASGVAADLVVCGGPSATDVYAGGGHGVIDHSTNGTSWDSTGYHSNTTTKTIRDANASSTYIWLVGDTGYVSRAATPFMNFTVMTTGVTSSLFGMEALNGSDNDVYVVGGNGTILHWNGTSWSAQASGVTSVLNDVATRTQTSGNNQVFLDVWAVGASGVILHGTR